MDSTSDGRPDDELKRRAPWIAAVAVAAVAVPLGLTRGAPAVVLWLAFALLAGAVLLFWEALRATLDPTAPGDETETDDEGVPAELETRKRAALQALRDIEFERSIGRVSEDDFKLLEVKYRAEARAAMRALDDGLGPWLSRADALLKAAETGTAAATPAAAPIAEAASKSDTPAAATEGDAARRGQCPQCATANDADAVFCKKCGTRLAAEVSDAS